MFLLPLYCCATLFIYKNVIIIIQLKTTLRKTKTTRPFSTCTIKVKIIICGGGGPNDPPSLHKTTLFGRPAKQRLLVFVRDPRQIDRRYIYI